MKYLVLKMYLGYGYTASEDEINASISFLKQRNVDVDASFDEEHIVKKDGIYYATYWIDSSNVEVNSIEYRMLISNFIRENNNKPSLPVKSISSESVDRACNLTIEFISDLEYLTKHPSDVSEDIFEKSAHPGIEEIEEPLENKHIKLFSKLSMLIGGLLDQAKKDHIEVEDEVDLKIVNPDPTKVISSYKAYYNFKLIDEELDGAISKVFGEVYGFALIFGTSSYYGMPSVKSDMYLARVVGSTYQSDPVYLVATEAPDWAMQRERQQLIITRLTSRDVD